MPEEFTKTILQILWKRVVIWKRLSHPNIARFRGVNTITEPFRLALVYDWAEDGNILRYTASHPDVSRSALVSILFPGDVNHLTLFWQLLQVAKGLQYLHSFGVPHGNLKGVRHTAPDWTNHPGCRSLPNKLTDFDPVGKRSGRCVRVRSADGLRVCPHQF